MNSDPFKRHGISHLSPSSLRLWRAEPAAWIGRYLLKVSDDIGPAAWRGTAVEAGVDMLLFGNSPELAINAMKTQWDFLAQGLVDPDAEKESGALQEFFVQAGVAYHGKPVPLQRQARVELEIPGIGIPLLGFADWLWNDCGSDLKTTWRIPRAGPDPAHVEQVACYAMYHGVPFDLTYCSPKGWTRYEVTNDMAVEAYDRVVEACHALRSFLGRIDSAEDGLSMFSPDYTSFYWRPPMVAAVKAAKAARTVPGEPRQPKLELVSKP